MNDGCCIVPNLPHIDIVSKYTLPDDIFVLNSVQPEKAIQPHIASVKVRDRKAGSEVKDEVEIKTLMYDADSADRDREITPAEFEDLLSELQNKYLFPFQTMNDVELRSHVYKMWDVDTVKDEGRDIEMEDIQMGYERNLRQILSNYMLFMRYNMVGSEDADTLYNMQIFNRMLKSIYLMNSILKSEYDLRKTTDEYIVDEEQDINIFRFTPQDYTKNTPYQNLLIYLLSKSYQKGYRLYRESCYKQIYHKGNPTHAWKFVCPVIAFVYSCINKEVNYEMWQNLTKSQDNARRASEYLISAHDKEFPELQPDRHLFSFTDGIYDAKAVTFYDYETSPLPSHRVAIKFFKQRFNARRLMLKYKDWYDIPTPDLQTILDFQQLPLEACKTLYMMIGRCLYEVGEMDSWEVILFIKGVAGSGKSTLGKILKYFYPTTDIATLSSNIEKKFGLQSIYDKLLYLCFEVKKNWGLDQGDFQCMVSGEEVSVAIKHKVAISVLWKTPGMLMGNEVAKAWMDAAGSMTRRILNLEFNYKVKNTDTGIQMRLRKNIPAIMHKCNMAYHAAVREIGTASIWNRLPQYFEKTKKKFSKAINPLDDFFGNCDLIEVNSKDNDLYMPLTRFKDMYLNFCRQNNYQGIRFNEDHYNTTFQSHGVAVVKATKMYEGVMKKNIRWILGVGLKEDEDVFDNT
jgi:phage/plasmid-associated DNA primase